MAYKLSKAISKFLQDSLISQSAISYGQYFRTLQRFKEEVEDPDLEDLLANQKMIGDFYSRIKGRYNLHESSLFLIALYLRVFFSYLKRQGLISSEVAIDDITHYQKYYKNYTNHTRNLTPEALYPFEEDQLRLYWLFQEPTILSLRNSIILSILFDTGIKISALRKLNKKSFNFGKNTLSYIVNNEPREVSISNETSNLLRSYLSIRTDTSDYLITNHSVRVTNTITNRSIERILKQSLGDLESTRKITSTNLRYTFIARKIAEGKKDSEISHLAGYKPSVRLQRFGLKKGTSNKPEKNIYRHIEDFKKAVELKKEWDLSKKELDKITSSKDIELRIIKSQKFIRESAVKKFIRKVKEQYTGYIRLSVRALEWGITTERLKDFCQLNPDKCKKIAKKWYIHEDVGFADIPPLKKRGRKKKI